jgi:hypothetical protein
VSRSDSYGYRGDAYRDEDGSLFSRWSYDNRHGFNDRSFFGGFPWRQQAPRDYPYSRGYPEEEGQRRPQRVDPDYFFNRQRPW